MNKKILVIDDNQDDLEIMKECLNQAGYDEIFFSESGEEGVKKAEEEAPDVVIIDTNMSGVNGFETCKRIKSFEKIKTKVIMITGFIDAFDAGKAREVGADDYVIKDASFVDLIEAVHNLFDSK